MKIAVIDDEPLWRKIATEEVEKFLESLSENMEISIYSSGEEFLEQSKEFDMIFMDIEMDGMNGIEAIYKYKKSFPDCLAAILTMHTQFALIGYKVNAFRYINKARMKEDIGEALSAARKELEKNKKMSFHIINMGEIQLTIRDIYFIETEKRNVRVHTRDGQYLSNQTISELELLLRDYGFYMAHKSTLVNLDAIWKIDVKRRRAYFYNESFVTVARQKLPELKRRYLEQSFELTSV